MMKKQSQLCLLWIFCTVQYSPAWGILNSRDGQSVSTSDTAEVPFVPTLQNYRGVKNSGVHDPLLDEIDDGVGLVLDRATGTRRSDGGFFGDAIHSGNPGNFTRPAPLPHDYYSPSGGSDDLNIQIEMSSTTNLTGSGREQMVYFIIKNVGKEDEYIHFNVSDEKGYAQAVPPTRFFLPSGSSQEISVLVNYPTDADRTTPDMITVNASGKGKRNTVKRSAYYYAGSEYTDYGNQYGYQQNQQPFCYDQYVTGNCRYRTDPHDCNKYKWTAYATIQTPLGIQYLRSIPEGVFTTPDFVPGTRDRIRVYLTVTCCVPTVQFISVNPTYPNMGTACIVDVSELQGLNTAEIVAIVVSVIIIIIIIIVVIALLIRRRRARTIMVGQPVSTRETE